jgi:hypothetical protein
MDEIDRRKLGWTALSIVLVRWLVVTALMLAIAAVTLG